MLTNDDAPAHTAAEDEATVRWLTGDYGTVETARAHFAMLARNAERGSGKRGFGVWWNGRLAGYVDADPDVDDGLEPGDVNISYNVHPWARGAGVAPLAVRAMCQFIEREGIGRRAAIRVSPDNGASVRVAEKCGFRYVRTFTSATDTHADGSAATLALYVLELGGLDR